MFPLYWRVKVIHPEWFGRRCRILVHPGGRHGNRLIEFDNGERVVCPGAYLRRVPVPDYEVPSFEPQQRARSL